MKTNSTSRNFKTHMRRNSVKFSLDKSPPTTEAVKKLVNQYVDKREKKVENKKVSPKPKFRRTNMIVNVNDCHSIVRIPKRH